MARGKLSCFPPFGCGQFSFERGRCEGRRDRSGRFGVKVRAPYDSYLGTIWNRTVLNSLLILQIVKTCDASFGSSLEIVQ